MGLLGLLLRPLWPILQLAALVCNPLTGVAKQVPQANAVRMLSRLSWPIAALRLGGISLKLVAPDIHRSTRVWRHVLPIFAGYMWTKWSTDLAARLFKWDRGHIDKRWQARHEKAGQEVFNMVTKVQGYYVKTGQVLATKREFVPQAWCSRLAHLWDQTPPRPWSNVRRSLLSDLQATQLAEQLHEMYEPKTASQKKKKAQKEKKVVTPDEVPPAVVEPTTPSKSQHSGLLSNGHVALPGQPAPARGSVDVPRINSAPFPSPTRMSVDMSPLKSPSAGPRSTSGLSSRLFTRALSGSQWLLSGANGVPGSPALLGATQQAWPRSIAGTSAFADEAEEDAAGSQGDSLFTVSKAAAEVMAQRAQSRPPPPTPIQTAAAAPRRGRQEGQLARWMEVDPTPLATASIAQVHAARLSPSLLQLLGTSWRHGPDVVVKVQHADVQRLMAADLRNLGRIGRFLKGFLPFDVMPAVREVQSVIPKEFDFEREARLMAALRARVCPRFKHVVIPDPVTALCGPGIIVMQRMQGVPLTSLLKQSDQGDAEARDQAKRCLEPILDIYGHMILVDGLFHADPHPGNMLLQADGKVALLDFGQCKALTTDERLALCTLYACLGSTDIRPALRAMAPFGLAFGADSTPASVNGAAAASTTGSDHSTDNSSNGLANGSVHSTDATASSAATEPQEQLPASPRAGSGLLSKLLSFGRHSNGKADDYAEFAGVNVEAVRKMLCIMFDTKWVAEGAYTFGGGDVVEGAPLASFPAPLYLVCRAILILRGILHALGVEDVSVVQRWRKYAQDGVREKRAVADARAMENAALDRGLVVEGL